MPENKIDIDVERKIHEFQRMEFYRKFKKNLGIDIVKDEQLEKIFANGMKDGSVIFVPRRDGTGILNIDEVIEGEKVAKNIEIDDKNEAAFLLGLQGSVDASKK